MFSLRGSRILILISVLIIGITLYTFYPSDPFRRPHSPDEPYDRYEAGGIDSDHYGERFVPAFNEGNGVNGAECDDEQCAPLPEPAPVAEQEKEVVWKPHAAGADRKQGTEVMDEETRSDPIEQSGDKSDTNNPDAGAAAAAEGWSEKVLSGGVIMPKLANATAKAELGRSAWRVLHLMTLRYPEEPTPDDRTTLKSFFHLFSRLYPCGECAEEFQKLLKEYPPQTSSRKSASMWLCSVHNMVNERLGKPEFDCLTLNETYDCGCGPEGETSTGSPGAVETAGPRSKEEERDVEATNPSSDTTQTTEEAGAATETGLVDEWDAGEDAE